METTVNPSFKISRVKVDERKVFGDRGKEKRAPFTTGPSTHYFVSIDLFLQQVEDLYRLGPERRSCEAR